MLQHTRFEAGACHASHMAFSDYQLEIMAPTGVPMVLSTLAVDPLVRVAEFRNTPGLFQLYSSTPVDGYRSRSVNKCDN